MMNQQMSGMAAPDEIQAELNNLSGEDKMAAKQALMEIRAIIEQMMAQGASEEEIMQNLEFTSKRSSTIKWCLEFPKNNLIFSRNFFFGFTIAQK